MMNRSVVASVKQISHRCLDITDKRFKYSAHDVNLLSEASLPIESRLYLHFHIFIHMFHRQAGHVCFLSHILVSLLYN
jgi:hypothetical protein